MYIKLSDINQGDYILEEWLEDNTYVIYQCDNNFPRGNKFYSSQQWRRLVKIGGDRPEQGIGDSWISQSDFLEYATVRYSKIPKEQVVLYCL